MATVDSGGVVAVSNGEAHLEAAGGAWQYLVLFVLAATPWLEILLVIPLGVARGLDPVAIAVVSVAGNVLTVVPVAVGFERLRRLFPDRDGEPSGRSARAKRLLSAYGLPGLALCAPVLTGVHLAAAIAVSLGSRPRRTLAWMSVGIVAWAIVITVASVTGRSALEWLV